MKVKLLSIAILTLLMISSSMSQQINYNAKAVRLIPETSFLPNADWKTLFYDDTKTSLALQVGLNKQIVIGSDEQVFISNRSNFTISILDKTGRLIKTFGRKGYRNGEFANNQDLDGILNNKLLVVSDNQGRINFFDLQGNFVNLITIDFMPLRIFPLQSNNLIIWGHVPVSGNKSKKVLAELDYKTGKYKVFYEKTESNERPDRIVIPRENAKFAIGAPYTRNRNVIRVTSDGQVIFANNKSNVVKLFSKVNGKYQESDFNIMIDPVKIGDQEVEEYYQNLKEKLRMRGYDVSYAEKVKTEGFFPEHLPYFYNLILDEQSNALFVIYTNNQNEDYPFRAYSLDGNFLGQSRFEIEGYDLLSKMSHFRFRNGYIYTLALKHGADEPLRILKCKVKK